MCPNIGARIHDSLPLLACRRLPHTARDCRRQQLGNEEPARKERVRSGGSGVEAARRGCDRAVDFVRVIGNVANHSSRVEPADACFRDCIGAAWQPLTVAPMLRPRRAMCVRRRLLPVIHAKVGKHWIARPRLMLCLWKQRCCTSTPTSSCTDSRTAPAMQRSRARRRDECSSSGPGARSALTRVAARPREREPGALAGCRGSLRQEAHRRLPQSRQRRAAGVADHNSGRLGGEADTAGDGAKRPARRRNRNRRNPAAPTHCSRTRNRIGREPCSDSATGMSGGMPTSLQRADLGARTGLGGVIGAEGNG